MKRVNKVMKKKIKKINKVLTELGRGAGFALRN